MTAGYREVREKVLRLLKGCGLTGSERAFGITAATIMTEVIEPMVWQGAEPRASSSAPTPPFGGLTPQDASLVDAVRAAFAGGDDLEVVRHANGSAVTVSGVRRLVEIIDGLRAGRAAPAPGTITWTPLGPGEWGTAAPPVTVIKAPVDQVTIVKQHAEMLVTLQEIVRGELGTPPRFLARKCLQGLGLSCARLDDRCEEPPPAAEPGLWCATTELRWLKRDLPFPERILQKLYTRHGLAAPGALPVIEEEWRDVPTVTE